MKSKLATLMIFTAAATADSARAAPSTTSSRLTDYIYDCEKPGPSKERILGVSSDLYLDVFWQLFNDLKDQDYARESVGVTPEQSECIGNMKVLLAQLYRKAPAAARKNPQFFARMGQYQSFNAQYKLAEEAFRQAAQIDPNSVTVNVELSRVLERRGKKKEQEQFLRAALNGNARTDDEKEMLAEVYNKLVEAFEPDPKKAAELVRAWLLLEPSSVNARTAQADLGLELADANMVEDAVKFLFGADKDYYAAHGAYLRKDWKEAGKRFRAYLKREDRDREYDLDNHRYLVKSMQAAGEPNEARREAELALNRWASDAELIQIHEKVVLEGGALDESNPVKDLELASSRNPRSRALKFRIVEVLLKDIPLKVDDSDPQLLRMAQAYVDKMLEQNPEDIEALYWKAFVRYHARAFTDADITMARVIEKLKEKGTRERLRLPASKVYTVASNIKDSLGYADEAQALRKEGAKLGGGSAGGEKTVKSKRKRSAKK